MAQDKWRIDKHIPVAMIVAFVIQAVVYGGVAAWWVSKMDSRLLLLEDFRAQSIMQIQGSDMRIQSLERDVPVIREKIQNIERATDRIEKKIDKLSLNWHMPPHALRKANGDPNEALFYLSLKELGEVVCS